LYYVVRSIPLALVSGRVLDALAGRAILKTFALLFLLFHGSRNESRFVRLPVYLWGDDGMGIETPCLVLQARCCSDPLGGGYVPQGSAARNHIAVICSQVCSSTFLRLGHVREPTMASRRIGCNSTVSSCGPKPGRLSGARVPIL